ncbi:Metallo-beta-lactamase superfamily [Seminavis robusta]|uniref:Metallo-beta-lactamase superfamily n=1 Tax=Seminavis robusta TaxID=568900 RepID=A0A9N8E0D7_9STRA|nr:Metallo-beta-lactamase superfamily [Seminavis robusta]|eukprot:Sro410_g137430.1 Metallo-beta-lactamase superfamily (621) ;mRNA; r:46697-48658
MKVAPLFVTSLYVAMAGVMMPLSTVAEGEGSLGEFPEENSADGAATWAMPHEDSQDETPDETSPDEPPTGEDPFAPDTDPPATTDPGDIEDPVANILELVTNTLGGADALLNMRFLQVMTTGEAEIEYEDTTPDEVGNAASFERNYTIDLFEGNVRIDELTVHEFEALQFFPPSFTTRIMQQTIGEQIGSKMFVPNGTMPSESVAALSHQLVFQNPHVLLVYILANDVFENITYAGLDRNDNAMLIVPDPDDIWPITMFVNTTSGFINKVTTRQAHPLVGDRRVTFRYFNWVIESEGPSPLLFPRRVRISNQNGKVVWDERRDSVMTPADVDMSMFEFSGSVDPDSFDAFAFYYGLANSLLFDTFDMTGFWFPWRVAYSDPQELAPGVTWMNAGTSASLVVEHADGLIVLEGFGSQFQTQLLLQAAGELFPGKSPTHVLQTHFHFDHSSGVREYLGAVEDVTLVIGDGTTEFWLDVMIAQHSIIPDSVETANVTNYDIVTVEFDQEQVLLDADGMVVTAYHTSRAEHAEDMMIFTVDVNATRILYQADLYNGGFGGTITLNGPQHLFDAMRDHSILTANCTSDVPLTIVSTHGIPITLEEALAELASLDVDVGCPAPADE